MSGDINNGSAALLLIIVLCGGFIAVSGSSPPDVTVNPVSNQIETLVNQIFALHN
jgi:hypothetical protein